MTGGKGQGLGVDLDRARAVGEMKLRQVTVERRRVGVRPVAERQQDCVGALRLRSARTRMSRSRMARAWCHSDCGNVRCTAPLSRTGTMPSAFSAASAAISCSVRSAWRGAMLGVGGGKPAGDVGRPRLLAERRRQRAAEAHAGSGRRSVAAGPHGRRRDPPVPARRSRAGTSAGGAWPWLAAAWVRQARCPATRAGPRR